ncbi:MAG: fumarylacetoacetate hydrolase family protein [Chloroflexi bacterium]|nr:fumarylacetoacetate hydrolase family protein [Chloroflexota bacterium]
MRLVTFRDADGAERLGAVAGDRVVDLAKASNGDLPASMLGLIEAGPSGLDRAREAAEQGASSSVALASVTLLAPIPRPRRNVFCLGLNYKDHAAEAARAAGQELKLPKYPIFFSKPPTCVIGPDAAIEFDPKLSTKIDWEIEFTFVIGQGGRDIQAANALGHVFGYTIANDVSARDLQGRHGGQFFKGKSLDTFCPLGPWIVTADEIPDPGNLTLSLRLNDVEKQRSNTRELIFDVPSTIESLSAGMTLEPGDVILTGTPHGVGFARTPPEYLQDGDVVECAVERIGVLRNPVRTTSGR